jgi:hypothetical protein
MPRLSLLSGLMGAALFVLLVHSVLLVISAGRVLVFPGAVIAAQIGAFGASWYALTRLDRGLTSDGMRLLSYAATLFAVFGAGLVGGSTPGPGDRRASTRPTPSFLGTPTWPSGG